MSDEVSNAEEALNSVGPVPVSLNALSSPDSLNAAESLMAGPGDLIAGTNYTLFSQLDWSNANVSSCTLNLSTTNSGVVSISVSSVTATPSVNPVGVAISAVAAGTCTITAEVVSCNNPSGSCSFSKVFTVI